MIHWTVRQIRFSRGNANEKERKKMYKNFVDLDMLQRFVRIAGDNIIHLRWQLTVNISIIWEAHILMLIRLKGKFQKKKFQVWRVSFVTYVDKNNSEIDTRNVE